MPTEIAYTRIHSQCCKISALPFDFTTRYESRILICDLYYEFFGVQRYGADKEYFRMRGDCSRLDLRTHVDHVVSRYYGNRICFRVADATLPFQKNR